LARIVHGSVGVSDRTSKQAVSQRIGLSERIARVALAAALGLFFAGVSLPRAASGVGGQLQRSGISLTVAAGSFEPAARQGTK
jgi:hypothetical protein